MLTIYLYMSDYLKGHVDYKKCIGGLLSSLVGWVWGKVRVSGASCVEPDGRSGKRSERTGDT